MTINNPCVLLNLVFEFLMHVDAINIMSEKNIVNVESCFKLLVNVDVINLLPEKTNL